MDGLDAIGLVIGFVPGWPGRIMQAGYHWAQGRKQQAHAAAQEAARQAQEAARRKDAREQWTVSAIVQIAQLRIHCQALGMNEREIERTLQDARSHLNTLEAIAREPIALPTIIEATTLRSEIGGYTADLLGRRLDNPPVSLRSALSEVFTSPTTLRDYVAQVARGQSILVLPVGGQQHIQDYTQLVEALRSVATAEDALSHENADRSGARQSGLRERRFPHLVVAPDLLLAGLELRQQTVARVREFLLAYPTICLEADVSPGTIMLDCWWWLPTDDYPAHHREEIRLPAHVAAQSGDILRGAAQLFMLLVCDLMSVRSFEGVSTLADILLADHEIAGTGHVPGFLNEWYGELLTKFEGYYGQLGIARALLPAPRSAPLYLAGASEQRAKGEGTGGYASEDASESSRSNLYTRKVTAHEVLGQIRQTCFIQRWVYTEAQSAHGWHYMAMADPGSQFVYVLAVTVEDGALRVYCHQAEELHEYADPASWMRAIKERYAVAPPALSAGYVDISGDGLDELLPRIWRVGRG